MHVDAAVAASAPEYFPGPQSVQSAIPVAALYLPVVHLVHLSTVAVISPVYPKLQSHAVILELVVGEFELTGQSVHATVPAVVLYLPVTHSVHVPPSGPV